MPTDLSRRTFLAASSASAAAARSPGTRLGLDFFSLRNQRWDAFELLEFCSLQGAQVANFSEPRFLGSLDADHLRQVRKRADGLGLSLEIGFGSICPTSTRFDADAGPPRRQLLNMLEAAKILGSPIVRCYLGSADERRSELPLEAHIENTVRSCRSVREEFVDAGVKIALENHAGDLQALQLKALIETAGVEYVGALLDSGNAAWTLEDPHHTLETLAPYAVTTGLRDSRIWRSKEGIAVMWVPFGEGNIDIRRFHKRFRELRPDLTFSLEIINLRSPRVFAVDQPAFWDHYRDVPAWVFRRFEQLAEQGEPYAAPQPPVSRDDDPKAFDHWSGVRERRDVEHDLQFCREQLGLGRRA